jgi:hypothetical protein
LATTGDHELAVDNWGTTALCELLQVQLRLHPQLTAERPSCGRRIESDRDPVAVILVEMNPAVSTLASGSACEMT